MFIQLDGVELGAVREARGPGRERRSEGEREAIFPPCCRVLVLGEDPVFGACRWEIGVCSFTAWS